jgi:divalent metal cation (Fe/Co/Zn/Cd) transporter
VRARWVGHRPHSELSITVVGDLSVGEGHEVSREVRHQLLHHVPHLGGLAVHVDPVGQGGEHHHRISGHAHDGLPVHVHD